MRSNKCNSSPMKVILLTATENMALIYLNIIGVAFLFQLGKGDWLEETFKSYTSPVMQPLYEVTKKLEVNIAELEMKRQELELHKKELTEKLAKIPKECQNENLLKHFSFFDKWDLNSCVTLTDDWNIGADLAMKGAVIALNITECVGEIGNNILDCPSKPVLKVLPCYNNNLLRLKDTLAYFREKNLPFIHNANIIVTKMRMDFDHCVGIPFTVKDKLERHMSNINC